MHGAPRVSTRVVILAICTILVRGVVQRALSVHPEDGVSHSVVVADDASIEVLTQCVCYRLVLDGFEVVLGPIEMRDPIPMQSGVLSACSILDVGS